MDPLSEEREALLDLFYESVRFVCYVLSAYPDATEMQLAHVYARQFACLSDFALERVQIALQIIWEVDNGD